jgi:hypothetical protein
MLLRLCARRPNLGPRGLALWQRRLSSEPIFSPTGEFSSKFTPPPPPASVLTHAAPGGTKAAAPELIRSATNVLGAVSADTIASTASAAATEAAAAATEAAAAAATTAATTAAAAATATATNVKAAAAAAASTATEASAVVSSTPRAIESLEIANAATAGGPAAAAVGGLHGQVPIGSPPVRATLAPASEAEAAPGLAEHARRLLPIYMQLSKFRLAALVAMSAAGGFAAAPPAMDLPLFVAAVAGTSLCIASANAMNQWLEVPFDTQMLRTANR